MKIKAIAMTMALLFAVMTLVSCGTIEEPAETTAATDTTAVTNTEAFTPTEDVNAAVVSVSSESFTLTNADMSYLFYTAYGELLYSIESSGFTPSLIGLDMSASLKSQVCGVDSEERTWFQYILDAAKSNAESMLAFCEAAKREGVELDDADRETVEETINEIGTYAEAEKSTLEEYVKLMYGPSVTSENVRKMLEMDLLASKYSDYALSKVDVSDAALEAKYSEHKSSYESFDYVAYGLSFEDILPSGADDAARAEAINTVNSYAAQMEACTDAESFIALAKKHMTEELGLTADEAESVGERLASEDVKYTSSGDIPAWAVEASVGDIKRVDEGEGVVSLYLLTAKKTRNEEELLRSVRHILFMKSTYSDDSKVKEVYDAWVAGGASVEELEKLAAEYSEDPGSAMSGGLYEGVTEGEMVEEFDEWLFDEARAPGDHAIVETASFGWHIMYYEGKTSKWKYDMKNKILTDAATAIGNEVKDACSVTYDDAVLATISA